MFRNDGPRKMWWYCVEEIMKSFGLSWEVQNRWMERHVVRRGNWLTLEKATRMVHKCVCVCVTSRCVCCVVDVWCASCSGLPRTRWDGATCVGDRWQRIIRSRCGAFHWQTTHRRQGTQRLWEKVRCGFLNNLVSESLHYIFGDFSGVEANEI